MSAILLNPWCDGNCPTDLLPDTQNCWLRMRRECRERFPRHQLQRKPPVSDPGMHHDTCVTHVPWCRSGSLTRGGGENVAGACATRNFTDLARGPCDNMLGPGRYGQSIRHDIFKFILFKLPVLWKGTKAQWIGRMMLWQLSLTLHWFGGQGGDLGEWI